MWTRRSLFDLVGKETDQEEGINTGFTELGWKVIDALLDNTNGRRILIDIKHMSAQARQEYFSASGHELSGAANSYHCEPWAANGLRSMNEPVADGKETAFKLLARDINFYDEEILRVARSKGIFAIQLDERRLASEATLQNIKHSLFINKIRHYRSELIWNQVQHILELLDRNGEFAWDCISIGSDFEGIINPVNGFLTEETMPELLNYLERHAFNYMQQRGATILQTYNQLAPAEIVNRIFYSNALQFIRQWL
jgi:microsomal dipeptidase-like Zn-dependent dipeptidase